MRRIVALCLTLSLLLPAMQAKAAPEEEFDGYLFQVKQGYTRLFQLAEGIEPVVEQAGIYRAASLEEIEGCVPSEVLEYVEPNYIVTLFDSPNDPMYDGQWSLKAMDAEAAWSAGLDGSGIRIGLVDSGLYPEHEDLIGAHVIPGHNYINNNEDTSDEAGHGTFVAGIIAAVRGNGTGVAGLAPGAEIVPLKCFNGKSGSVSEVVAAIYGGVDDYDCDILNMSFGLAKDSQLLEAAIDHAAERGVILVAAVGNYGTAALYYPAAYDAVIGVGSVGEDKVVAAKSQKNESVYVTAPGHQVLGLSTDTQQGSYYKPGNGTSYAAPHVAAAIALLKQAQPGLDREEVMQLLAGRAEDLGEPGYDTSYGHGFVSLRALHLFAPPWYSKTELALDGLLRGNVTDLAGIQSALAAIGTQQLLDELVREKESSVAQSLAALEERAGIRTEITIKEDAPAEFAAGQIGLAGAALNAAPANQAVRLELGGPGENEPAVPVIYDNAVTFSMTLTGVASAQNLAVPVQVTMPVPAGIKPQRLAVLHHLPDGSCESVPVKLRESEGQTYAVFCVTGFGDFTMAQSPAGTTLQAPVRNSDGSVSVLVQTQQAVTLIAVSYRADGQMSGTQLLRVDAKDVEQKITFSLPYEENGTVKVFAVNEAWQPACSQA